MGRKKKSAASSHKLIEEVPLCAAAAIQRGPRTVAMLKKRTSQKPISLRSCLIGSEEPFALWLTESRPARELARLPAGKSSGQDPRTFRTRPRARKILLD